MSDQILDTSATASGGSFSTDLEYEMQMVTGVYKMSVRISEIPEVQLFLRMFHDVTVTRVTVEIRQDSLIGEEATDIAANGHIFVALIPNVKNTDAASGGTAVRVLQVKHKQTFPLSRDCQNNKVFELDLEGYETDISKDPRQGGSPCLWLGNSGVRAYATGSVVPVCTARFWFFLTCKGKAVIW